MGYTAYFKKLYEVGHWEYVGLPQIIKHYVDSLKLHKKIVPLVAQHETMFKDSLGREFELNTYGEEIVSDLFDERNIKVYDFRKKCYLKKVLRKKIMDSEGERYQFSDANTGKVFFTFTLSSPVY